MKRRCAINTCEKTEHARGYCKTHYERWRRHGDAFKRLKSDPNEIIIFDQHAEIVLYDNSGEEIGRASIDLDDVDRVKKYKWHFSNGYIEAKINRKKVSIHRFLMGFPLSLVDHKNGMPADNRKDNLRSCDHQGNAINSAKQKNNTSGYRGVTWHKRHKKWMAAIYIDNTTKLVGYFDDKEEANKARLDAEIIYFGEFSPFLSRKENFYAQASS